MSKLWFMGEALIDFLPVTTPLGTAYLPICGGSPYNAAKAAAIAGADVGFLGALSTDLFGLRLADDLAAHGIDIAQSPRTSDPTTLAFVDVTSGEPRYAFFNAASAIRQMNPDPARFTPGAGDIIAFGSISLVDPPGADAITRFAIAMADRATLALDPNARPAMTADMAAWRNRINAVAALACIVKLSAEDLDALAPGTTPAQFASARFRQGPGLVIVTHGANGAEAFTPAGHARCPGHRVQVADTVGAGDTLTGTFLADLAHQGLTRPADLASLSGERLAALLRPAIAAATLTCQVSGCQPPRPAQVRSFLADLAAGQAP